MDASAGVEDVEEDGTRGDGPPVPALADRARDCAAALAAADRTLVVCHDDADGLTSGAVASAALRRAGLAHDVAVVDGLDAETLAGLPGADYDALFFTDIGSGQATAVADAADRDGVVPVVADHHQHEGPDLPNHCNPLLEGLDGASELSGAGAAYLVARALAERCAGDGTDAAADRAGDVALVTPADASGDDGTAAPDPPIAAALADPPRETVGVEPDPLNRDLAALAVIGAVGDRQADGGGLTGANEAVVADAVAAGALETDRGLALYGTQTRPLPRLLAYAGELRVPGISDDRAGAAAFLDDLPVEARRDADGVARDRTGEGPAAGDTAAGTWRTWADLDAAERRTVASAICQRALRSGVPAGRIEALVGRTYTLPGAPPGTELRDAAECSTLLNATARYDRAGVGLAVCLGDRDAALAAARELLREHRRTLSSGLEYVRSTGTTRAERVQYIDVGSAVPPTVVGIVAGMAMGGDGVPGDVPIVAFADDGPDDVKVSARGTGRLVRGGLDLAAALSTAAAAVDGEGGGHDVAAGATIPADARDAFLERVDGLVGEQLD